LDLGFSTKEHRKKFIDRLSSEGIAVRIQFLDVDAEERKQRVEKRNQEKGETFMMTVDDSLFDFMENLFEAPSEEEGVPVQVV
jgi:hypothetical protein